VQQLRCIQREAGAAVHGREVQVEAWRNAAGTNARLDVAFVANGIRTYVDVTIRHPRAQKYRARAREQDAAAARIAEQAKRVRYPARPEAGLLAAEPFAMETFGRLGPNALKLLREAEQRAAELDPALRGWTRQALRQRWLALLSVQLQRGLHEAAAAAWGQRPSCGEAEPEGGPLLAACLPFAGAGS